MRLLGEDSSDDTIERLERLWTEQSRYLGRDTTMDDLVPSIYAIYCNHEQCDYVP